MTPPLVWFELSFNRDHLDLAYLQQTQPKGQPVFRSTFNESSFPAREPSFLSLSVLKLSVLKQYQHCSTFFESRD